jgi:hypothetical protein
MTVEVLDFGRARIADTEEVGRARPGLTLAPAALLAIFESIEQAVAADLALNGCNPLLE